MDWNLIHKYLSGECSDSEKDIVKRWIREDPKHKEFMDLIENIWEVTPRDEVNVDAKAAWDQFKYRVIDEKSEHDKTMPRQSPAHNIFRAKARWYKKPVTYAAAAVFMLLVVLFFVMEQNGIDDKTPVEPTMQKVMTEKGERTNVKLNDGTRVILSTESTLRIPSNYGEEERILYLSGEAFFEVTHDESRPFIVYSGNVYTEDLGTKFNIRAFPGDQEIEVAVAEGKVELGKRESEGQNDSVELNPNQVGSVSADGTIAMRNTEDLVKYVGWTEGKFKFDNTPFRNVVDHLERWYDVECVVRDSELLDRRFTATFSNESLSYVLRLISASMDIQYEEKEEKGIIVFESISDN